MTTTVDVSARPQGEAGNFRRRPDGDWDYFPRLDSPRGYRVTLAQREALEQLDKGERIAGWILGCVVSAIGRGLATDEARAGLWVFGNGLIAWGIAAAMHRLIITRMLGRSAPALDPLSDAETSAIQEAGEARGATGILGNIALGAIGGTIVPVLKHSGVHGLLAWTAAILLVVALWFALVHVWAGLRRRVVPLFRGAPGRIRL